MKTNAWETVERAIEERDRYRLALAEIMRVADDDFAWNTARDALGAEGDSHGSPSQLMQQEVDSIDMAENLHDAIVWITSMVIGNGLIRAKIPASLGPLIAQRMVDDPDMGWPDVASALAELEEEGHLV